jgi:ribosomal protein S10
LKAAQIAIREACLSIVRKKRLHPLPNTLNAGPADYQPTQVSSKIMGSAVQDPRLSVPKISLSQVALSQDHGHNSLGHIAQVVSATPSRGHCASTQLSNIPLPLSQKRFTLLRSPHIDKKSREQFQLQTHRCRIDASFCSKGEASLFLFLLRNGEFPGAQVRVEITSSTPLFQ